MNEKEKLAKLFGLFSNEARIRIVEGLKGREMCVAEIRRHIGLTQEATSQHLRILRDARAVKSRKDGLLVFYSLDQPYIAFIQKEINGLFEKEYGF